VIIFEILLNHKNIPW